MLARDGAVLTRTYSMAAHAPIYITVGLDVLQVSIVTVRAFLKHEWIFLIEEDENDDVLRTRTYAITEAGRNAWRNS